MALATVSSNMAYIRNLCIALCGIATHIFYFNRSEHHMHVTLYLKVSLLIFGFSVAYSNISNAVSIKVAVQQLLPLFGSYLTGVYLSTFIYRLLLSPLRSFPGPLAFKLSSISFPLTITSLDAHTKLVSLHQKHGDFLRVGPSTLSIVHPKSVQAIYGHGTKCTKADWYDLTLPMVSMQTTRDRALHDQRRRIWSKAFGDKSLRGYEKRIDKFQGQFVSKLVAVARSGERLNITKLFNLYSFDVMGDLAFGKSFDMLKQSELHWAIKLITEAMGPLGLMLPTSMFRTLTAIPFATRGWWKFIDYCCERLDERMQNKETTSDILATLLEPYNNKRPEGQELKMLQGDTQLIVVAGSDTTATTLSSLVYELLRNPSHIPILRDEIAPLVNEDGTILNQELQYLDHLNAVINETLRLHPPVGTGLQRTTPPEGIHIGDTYVPGDVTVQCPLYVVGRNPKAFANPTSFIPERWTTSPSLVLEKSAFSPFSTGAYSCIGKPLALLNIRSTVAKMIMGFDFSFAKGETGVAFERDLKAQFTAVPGDMWLNFRERR